MKDAKDKQRSTYRVIDKGNLDFGFQCRGWPSSRLFAELELVLKPGCWDININILYWMSQSFSFISMMSNFDQYHSNWKCMRSTSQRLFSLVYLTRNIQSKSSGLFLCAPTCITKRPCPSVGLFIGRSVTYTSFIRTQFIRPSRLLMALKLRTSQVHMKASFWEKNSLLMIICKKHYQNTFIIFEKIL